jgi:predicted membrane channel-forming protein YqfA (hemolysin III family)
VSRREGWAGIVLAATETASLAVTFQAHNLLWGGIVMWATLALTLVGILVISAWASRARGVRPRGFTRQLVLAGAWAVLIDGVGGWFWIAQGPHSTSALLTTVVAVVAFLPMGLVFARVVREGS